jgi:hypothetical protein
MDAGGLSKRFPGETIQEFELRYQYLPRDGFWSPGLEPLTGKPAPGLTNGKFV